MKISNQVSPSFGRIYIREDRLSHEQYLDSLTFAQELMKSKIYNEAHQNGVDILITAGGNEEVKVLYVNDESGRFYKSNKNKVKRPLTSKLDKKRVETNLSNILSLNYNKTMQFKPSRIFSTVECPGIHYNAEPSDYNEEHIWFI